MQNRYVNEFQKLTIHAYMHAGKRNTFIHTKGIIRDDKS